MNLWIGNQAPGTIDDEIKALVEKYGTELECISIQRIDGDGSRRLHRSRTPERESRSASSACVSTACTGRVAR